MIKSGNKEPSKSTSWKVLETVMSHLKRTACKPVKGNVDSSLNIAIVNVCHVIKLYFSESLPKKSTKTETVSSHNIFQDVVHKRIIKGARIMEWETRSSTTFSNQTVHI